MIRLYVFISLIFCSSAQALEYPKNIRTGDLLFIDLDCGEFCDAVTSSTYAQFGRGPKLSHMGMFQVNGARSVYIYEALPKVGVVKTSYVDLVGRLQKTSKKRISERLFFGRIRPEFRPVFIRAAGYIRGEVGKPYNDTYSYHSKGFYCSQLIQAMTIKGGNGLEVFSWRPMSFGKSGSKERGLWENYFKKIGAKIPEEELGVSPLGIYLDGKGKVFD